MNENDNNMPDANNQPPRLSDENSTPADASAASEAQVIGGALSELDQIRKEADQAKKEFLYLRAEFENFKKQVIKERSDLRKFGAERLFVEILGILDIFETALSAPVTPEAQETFRKGIEMTAQELRSVLQRHGVQELPAHGINFDPTMHEALGSEESDASPGTITQVFKKPYRLHDRIIRPGQVVVAKPKS